MPNCPSVRPSKVLLISLIYQKDGHITVLLFWYGASLGSYQSNVLQKYGFNHLKGHFERSDRPFDSFFPWKQFSQKLFDNLLSILT